MKKEKEKEEEKKKKKKEEEEEEEEEERGAKWKKLAGGRALFGDPLDLPKRNPLALATKSIHSSPSPSLFLSPFPSFPLSLSLSLSSHIQSMAIRKWEQQTHAR